MANQSVCEAALDKHEERLSALPHVVGLGIVALGEGDAESSRLGIAVYVDRKVPKNKLGRAERVPKYVRVKCGKRLCNVYTRVIEQGPVHLESARDDGFSKESI